MKTGLYLKLMKNYFIYLTIGCVVLAVLNLVASMVMGLNDVWAWLSASSGWGAVLMHDLRERRRLKCEAEKESLTNN